MLEKISNFLKKCGRHRMIRRNGEDYLERFYLFSTRFLGIYIHRFWSSDDDGLHDHPWNSISILLSGVYFEEEPERQLVPYGPTIKKYRAPLYPPFKIRSKYAAHRITVPDSMAGKTWTLFIRFGFKRRKWGFYRNGSWQPAEVQSRKMI